MEDFEPKQKRSTQEASNDFYTLLAAVKPKYRCNRCQDHGYILMLVDDEWGKDREKQINCPNCNSGHIHL